MAQRSSHERAWQILMGPSHVLRLSWPVDLFSSQICSPRRKRRFPQLLHFFASVSWQRPFGVGERKHSWHIWKIEMEAYPVKLGSFAIPSLTIALGFRCLLRVCKVEKEKLQIQASPRLQEVYKFQKLPNFRFSGAKDVQYCNLQSSKTCKSRTLQISKPQS